MRVFLCAILLIVLPVSWLVADFRGSAKIRRILGVIVILWSSLVAVGIAGAYYMLAHSVPSSKLERVHTGLSEERVVALLGKPQSVFPVPDGRVDFRYDRPWLYCIVNVYLDSSHHVSSVWHDH
jgi:hypothetical protein